MLRYTIFAAGVLCAAAGLLSLIVDFQITPASARLGFFASSMGLLLIALPALALPWSPRIAKVMITADLGLFALAMLWIGFHSPVVPASPAFRAAAVGFAALLILRIGWAMRRRTRKP